MPTLAWGIKEYEDERGHHYVYSNIEADPISMVSDPPVGSSVSRPPFGPSILMSPQG